MELDPREEVIYRFNLALEQVETATRRFSIEDWVGVVQASQLAVENAAKAIISHFFMPSWTHNPSGELKVISTRFPERLKEDINQLIEIVSTLAPEHGRTSYGIPTRRITPRQIYDRLKAREALNMALKAISISRRILEYLGYKFTN